MIFLVTGLPGNGKTYFTVWKANELLNGSNRSVFVSGIPELKLPWQECDPKKWYDLPDGSAVIIDEAQRVFPVHPVGAPRGKEITELETHRHRGFDIWLITQHANLLDSHVRRLIQTHYHIERPFGLGRANVFQWEKVTETGDYHARKLAVRSSIRFNSEVWSQYKSATLHTVKKRIPWKLWLLPIAVLALAVLAFFVYRLMTGQASSAQELSKASRPGVTVPGNGAAPAPRGHVPGGVPPIASGDDWRLQYLPRDFDDPASAPRYDELTKPVLIPAVTMCWQDHRPGFERCECKGQMGAPLPVSDEFCRRVMRKGLPFRDYLVPTSLPNEHQGEEGTRYPKPVRAAGGNRAAVPSISPLQTAPGPFTGAEAQGGGVKLPTPM